MSPADPDSERLLLQVAEEIADARPVTWDERTAELTDPDLRSRFDNLRMLERLALAFRSGAPSAVASNEHAPVLFTWGDLEVCEKLGEGGFGEVYRAYDSVLDREVALKLRKQGPSRHGAGGRRYIREARRLARLRHPHVISVHGADEHDGRVGFWMDLIDGQTLADVVRVRGPLSAEEALSVGRVICSALAAVHGAGMVHGDVKPSNVMRERGGRVVLMDLGAASLMRTGAEVEWVEQLQGTPLAMAPELLGGAAPTAAADIYSLGVLLYYLVSGAYPVRAKSFDELVALHRDGDLVPLRDRRPDLPAAFLEVVERALVLDPEARFPSAGAMERALGRAMGGPQAMGSLAKEAAVRSRPWRLPALSLASRLALGAALVTLLAAAVGLYRSFREPDPTLRLGGHRMVPLAGRPRQATLSPDGSLVAYVNEDADDRPQIWVASLAGGQPTQVTSGDAGVYAPHWSSRGEILFGSADSIWAVAPLGGVPRQVIARARNPSVSADGGTIAFERRGAGDGITHVWIASADGSAAQRVATRSGIVHPARPALSPDGKWVAYIDYTEGPLGDVWVAEVEDRAPRRLTFDMALMGSLTWTPDGESIVFSSNRGGSPTLWSIAARGGEPEPVTSGVGEDDHPAFSADGRTFAYTNVRTHWGLMIRDTVDGTDRQVAEARSPFLAPTASPDGTRIAFFRPTTDGVHLFVMRVDGTDLRQVTTVAGEHNIFPSWSGDGRLLYYSHTRPRLLLRRVAAVGGESVTLGRAESLRDRPRVSPDGSRVYGVGDRTVIRDLETDAETRLSVPTGSMNIGESQYWSSAGRMIAQTTDTVDAGNRRTWNVVVCAAADGACRVLTAGHTPAWTPDDTRLFFLRPHSRYRELWSIDLDGENLTPHGLVGPFRYWEVWIDALSGTEVLYPQIREGAPEMWIADVQ